MFGYPHFFSRSTERSFRKNQLCNYGHLSDIRATGVHLADVIQGLRKLYQAGDECLV
jgi:hypothetical protein